MFEVGRMCMKTAGREAGRYCVVIDVVDKDFVLITGPKIVTGVRRRKCNKKHLEPVPLKIDIKKNATDDDVLKAYEKAKVYEKLRLKKPTEEEIRLAKQREAEKEAEEKPEAKPTEKKAEEKKEEVKPEKKKEKPKEEKKTKEKKEKKEKPKEKQGKAKESTKPSKPKKPSKKSKK